MKRSKTRFRSITLFAQNGSRFVVIINSYLIGIPLRTRFYQFDNYELAQRSYHRLCQRYGHYRKIRELIYTP